jgi:hypothetical protein
MKIILEGNLELAPESILRSYRKMRFQVNYLKNTQKKMEAILLCESSVTNVRGQSNWDHNEKLKSN